SNDPANSEPGTGNQVDNYLRGKFRDGTTRPPIAFNELIDSCSSTPPMDKRVLLASAPYQFKSGETIHVAFALLASPPKFQNGCTNLDLSGFYQIADSAKEVFCNPLPLSVKEFLTSSDLLKIY